MPNPNKCLCPYCHQPLFAVREGVRLTPLKAAIFDAVKASGEEGVTSYSIISTVYERRPHPSVRAIKSHVFQINELLADAGYRIRSGGERPHPHWRLILTVPAIS
jgi:hypothetical protein